MHIHCKAIFLVVVLIAYIMLKRTRPHTQKKKTLIRIERAQKPAIKTQ